MVPPDSLKPISNNFFSAIGNCQSEVAEFNFFADPEAAHVVLKNSKCKLTILPWEACMQENIDISMVLLSERQKNGRTSKLFVFLIGFSIQRNW